MQLFSFLLRRLSVETEEALKGVFSPLAPYLRQLGKGMVLVLLSTLSFMLTFLALAGAVFFAFLHNTDYAFAALWTSLLSLGAGILILTWGLYHLRPPRRRQRPY